MGVYHAFTGKTMLERGLQIRIHVLYRGSDSVSVFIKGRIRNLKKKQI